MGELMEIPEVPNWFAWFLFIALALGDKWSRSDINLLKKEVKDLKEELRRRGVLEQPVEERKIIVPGKLDL
jgi:hypothetical protein